MADVFGATTTYGGVFKGTTFGIADKGALVQGVQVQYQRQVSRVWELGSMKQYFLEGHTEGQGSIEHIVGPKGLINELAAKYKDICSTDRTMVLSASTAECGDQPGGTSTITLAGVLVTALSFQSQAQNHMVNSSMQIMFTGMSE
jgi:hypothetical protein